MKLHELFRRNGGQKGFSLIEILAALAITGLIGAGAATATIQIFTQGSRNTDYTTASRHTMNAIYWISRDAQMSQNLSPAGGSGFPITLSWVEWDNSAHQVIYSIEDDTIRRSYSINGSAPKEIVVAHYINSISENTTCAYADKKLTLTVTSTVGEGAKALSVTKIREIHPRPRM
ncbi:MAG: hypothetical protein A2144_04460 [Chloroflexi bacterium RBG_16_50_9]|nr:MAG: hypothetical protein A2144_04460 [Chloroflexi bacterium RBG_16_50_9]